MWFDEPLWFNEPSWFDELSQIPWFSVHTETWECIPIEVNDEILSTKKKADTVINKLYEEKDTALARLVTWDLWEEVLRKLLWCKKKNQNGKTHDLVLPNGEDMEVKTSIIWNVTVVKKHQLKNLEKGGFYWMVFYRTKKGLLPSYFISQDVNLKPETYLKRNIYIKKIFIIPKPSIVHLYNTSKLKERRIWKNGPLYKWFWIQIISELFDENNWNYNKCETIKTYWKNDIEIFSLWYEL